ncbi:MAG: hypothetical protein A3H35_10725 [Betaproteobacteria bacterium RIFCSPLOWO2_02_FULL_62_17]|nr:MAG: hypothetical protein A3H35_10725 [Betaproteobacteria bacterium RIFCSPLOWO2_02_FULL_62_17]
MELGSRNRAIARAVLEGRTVSSVAREWGLSTGRCNQLVHEVCRRLDPELYRSLQPPELSRACLQILRQYVDAFLEQMDDDPALTLYSSVRRISSLPTITLHALLNEGIRTVEDLMNCKPEKLLRVPVIGRVGLRKIQDALRLIEMA